MFLLEVNIGGVITMLEEYAISFDELSEEKKKEFNKLADDYSYILQLIYLFIEVNNLDNDEIWNMANQRYDEDMTYAPNED
jgi:2-oxo-4-hydroxy-4-carboxy--5-ureidoimidazoline (OHCU) decarboxylase